MDKVAPPKRGLLQPRHEAHERHINQVIACWVKFDGNKATTFPDTILPQIKYPKILFDGKWHAMSFEIFDGKVRFMRIDGIEHRIAGWVLQYQTRMNM